MPSRNTSSATGKWPSASSTCASGIALEHENVAEVAKPREPLRVERVRVGELEIHAQRDGLAVVFAESREGRLVGFEKLDRLRLLFGGG